MDEKENDRSYSEQIFPSEESRHAALKQKGHNRIKLDAAAVQDLEGQPSIQRATAEDPYRPCQQPWVLVDVQIIRCLLFCCTAGAAAPTPAKRYSQVRQLKRRRSGRRRRSIAITFSPAD